MSGREMLGAVGLAVVIVLGVGAVLWVAVPPGRALRAPAPPPPAIERWQVSPTTACYTLDRAPLGCATELPPEPAEGYPRGWPQGNRT